MQNCITPGQSAAWNGVTQIVRIMRLTTFLLLACCLHVAAKGISQNARVTLSVKQVSLDRFFVMVEKQTEYRFSYSTAIVPLHKKIDIEANNEALETVLHRALQQLGLSYRMMNEKLIGITDARLKPHTAPAQIDTYTTYWADTLITIHGTVTDESGKPLANASVQVKGTAKGVNTGQDGKFTITIPAAATVLDISSLNYQSRMFPLTTGVTTYTIVLPASAESLSEVVVVAYGVVKKGTYTGSVSQITSEKIGDRPVTNILNVLDGAAPGVQSTAANGQPGSSPAIRIRGFASVSASNAPLYVVDGVIYDGNIANLGVDDIDNFSILKDAAATSLYGNKAANGVVMITTKKGKKGSNKVSVKASQGFYTRGIAEYDRVDAYQYYPLMWEAYRNSLVYPALSTTTPIPQADASKLASGLYPRFTTGANAGKQNYNGAAYSDISQLLLNNPFNVAGNALVKEDGTLNPDARLLYTEDLDWYKAMARTGNRKDYSVATSGGTDKSDYYISFGYNNEKGFVTKSDYQRFSGRINVNSNPLKWFKTGMNLSGAISKGNYANDASSTGFANPFYFTRDIGPIYPIYQHDATGAYLLDAKGNKQYELGVNRASGAKAGRNVVAETEWNEDVFKRNIVSARTFGTISFLRDFTFTSNISVDLSNFSEPTYTNKIIGDGSGDGGRASNTATTTTSYTFNQLLSYSKNYNQHHIDVLAGHENYDYTYKYVYGARSGQVLDGNTELINFTTTTSLTSYTYNDRTESYLSRLNYDYQGRYLLSASYRRDGSSRFYKDSRWGNFWSVGAGWRLDQENFLAAAHWVNLLKIRASYGVVGNNFILNTAGTADNYYAWQALYQLNRNNAAEPGYIQSALENKGLKWESNKQLDLGVDFSLFKNRLSGTVEYFHKNSYDLLYNVPLPVSAGLDTKNMNIGTAYNRGIEVQLTGQILQQKNFSWSMDINWTTFTNKITSQPQTEIVDGTKKRMVGRSIYDYWLRQWYGVDPEDGAGLYLASKYVAANSRITKNGDTVTTDYNNAKLDYFGTAIPDFYGSVTNNLSYKNFKLSFLISYQVGGKTYDVNYATVMNSGNYGEALHTDLLKRWQKKGDITDVPRMDFGQVTNYGAQSTRWLVSSSYLNFRSVNLSYTLPKKLASRLFVQGATIYAGAENLGWITARKGMNPQQSYSGVTSNVYAPARVYTIGLNVSL